MPRGGSLVHSAGEETTLKDDACRDAIALNAGMGLYVAGVSESVAAGVDKAKEGLASGAVYKRR